MLVEEALPETEMSSSINPKPDELLEDSSQSLLSQGLHRGIVVRTPDSRSPSNGTAGAISGSQAFSMLNPAFKQIVSLTESSPSILQAVASNLNSLHSSCLLEKSKELEETHT